MSFEKYPVYKDSGLERLGQVPEHWVLTPIKYLALLNPKKSGFAGDTEQLCSFVPMEKLKTGALLLDEERRLDEVIGGYTYFENGDVLQAKVTPCFENKNIAIAQGLKNGIGFGSSEINVLRPYQGVTPKYLFYRVQEDSYMSLCTSSMIGAGGLKRVPTDVINDFKIAAPTISEQTQIARFLDHETARIDALIAEQQRLIELLKEKRQAVISHAVTKGLNPNAPMKDSGVEWLGEVPAHWSITRLGQNISTRKGFAFSATDFADEGVPVVKASDIKRYSINEPSTFISSDFLTRTPNAILKKNNLVLSTVGSTPDVKNSAVGQIGRVPEHLDGALLNQNTVIFEPTSSKVSEAYLFFTLLTTAYRDHLDLHAHGTANQASLSLNDMLDFWIPLPDLDEQIQISNALSRLLENLAALEKESEALVELLTERRSALISAAVTGKIDVRGWHPPASTAPALEQETH